MAEMKYLYGAAVQGIQSFIYQTNKLKEIVGANELVGEICCDFFKEKVGMNFKEENLIRGRGGKIQYIFDNEEDCKTLVRIFPKEVQKKAPGITFSQAVVRYEGILNKDHLESLELKLKVQRNRIFRPFEIGFMITERSRRTGNAGIKYGDEEIIDKATLKKVEKEAKSTSRLMDIIKPDGYVFEDIPRKFDQITKFSNDAYLAVIYADGNGLGAMLQRLESMIEKLMTTQTVDTVAIYRSFTKALNTATKNAARDAYALTYKPIDKLTFRPIDLGGDDFTVVCDAQHALKYTSSFLKSFELETKTIFETDEYLEDLHLGKMTACAGIAYVKNSYPFHYAIQLAEELVKDAKKYSKEISATDIPASLCFHKVQSSFIESYEEIKKRELTASGILLTRGPYFLSAQPAYLTVRDLEDMVEIMLEEESPVSSLRNWLSELYISRASADVLLERIIQILKQKGLERYIRGLRLEFAISGHSSHLYDVLSISSIKGRRL